MDRRYFLSQSGLGLSSIAVAQMADLITHTSRATEPPLKYKSVKYWMIEDGVTVLEKFQLAKDIGFHGIELDWPHELDEDEILEARDKTGILIPGVINSVHWKQPLSHADPAVRQTCVDATIEGLHKAKLYGGDTVLLVAGVVNAEISYAEAWDRCTTEIKKILPAAHQTGVKIAIENVWNNFLISPLEAARFVDQFDSDHIGWYFDIGNIVRYGWPAHWIEALAERIIKIDIKDYSRKKQVDEGIWEGFKVKLGEGDSDWPAVNRALSKVGYKSGWGSAEVSGGDRARLQEISNRMDTLYSM